MNESKQAERNQDSLNISFKQSKKQSDCNFNNDYYGDRVCLAPSNQKK